MHIYLYVFECILIWFSELKPFILDTIVEKQLPGVWVGVLF